MSKEKTYAKLCNPSTLRDELKSANISIEWVSNNGKDQTTIALPDAELKDPTPIVNDHTYTKPLTPEEARTVLKEKWLLARNNLDSTLATQLKEILDIITDQIFL